MAPHFNVLAWRIPGMGEPGGLLSMGSQSQTRLKRLSSSSSLLNMLARLTERLHPSENILLMALAQDVLWLSVWFSRYT